MDAIEAYKEELKIEEGEIDIPIEPPVVATQPEHIVYDVQRPSQSTAAGFLGVVLHVPDDPEDMEQPPNLATGGEGLMIAVFGKVSATSWNRSMQRGYSGAQSEYMH